MLGTPLGAEQAHIDACPPGAALCQECEALILTHADGAEEGRMPWQHTASSGS